MLVIDVLQIPPEGLEIDTPLQAGEVHVEGEESFTLEAGGTLRCRLEKGDDVSVHVRGRLDARLRLECGRCLAAFPFLVEEDIDVFYLPHRADQEDEEEDEIQLTDRDMVVAYYRGAQLDLGDLVREQLFLSVPLKRLCREECRGLCPSCGASRNLSGCDCPPREDDPRLAPLKEFFEKGSS